MGFSRGATVAGVAAFVLVQAAVAFGSFVVASIQCCTSVRGAWPTDPAEWIAVAIFAIVMTLPAALIGLGVAMLAEGIRKAIAVIAARRRR